MPREGGGAILWYLIASLVLPALQLLSSVVPITARHFARNAPLAAREEKTELFPPVGKDANGGRRTASRAHCSRASTTTAQANADGQRSWGRNQVSARPRLLAGPAPFPLMATGSLPQPLLGFLLGLGCVI